ncbi:MAG: tRNA (N(6)-L-threonylcarbamoyladenosine(37)-C(2))-methylthiotransferase MtaB [Candidatus Eisenbacteria bacterium]|nr:tRNA (N(6)-L-threonylcarbamoyladenosine(37)-C(2))-methylthiotransferase MtaB [Candidatus Eisenbacteria bacterium]
MARAMHGARIDPEGSMMKMGQRGLPRIGPDRSASLGADGAPVRGRFALLALGCRVNQTEMECLRTQLQAHGYREVPFGQAADLTVVNTCTVTSAGDSDSRQMLRRARRASPEGRIVATGCYAQREPRALARAAGVDLILGNRYKEDLGRYLQLLEQTRPPREAGASCTRIVVETEPGGGSFLHHAPGEARARTRAVIKIQDGCDEHCTYCIIPAVRGASTSRPWREVAGEARRLADSGVKEVALTGINSGAYGLDGAPGAERSLARLLRRLEEIAGIERIRLNSVEPGHVTAELVEALRSERICPHLHIPLQSGDDEILKRMGRTYDSAEYAARLERVRRARPETAAGADVMVGFPGETPEHFARTRDFVERMGFSYLHVFSYSVRPGTPAERLHHQVPVEVRRRRSRELRALDRELRRRYMERRRGATARVLIELERDGESTGLTEDYLRAVLPGRPAAPGEMLTVRLERPLDGRRMAAIPAEAGDRLGTVG